MTFTPDIYEIIRQGCIRSAQQVVPVLVDIFKPSSVIDVGGGEGWWACEFALRGVERVEVHDESVTERRDHGGVVYVPTDLESHGVFVRPQSFDLALCLEVAEHLQGEAADELIAQLCTAASVVVFSAAVPGQGGHGHVNEQWPDYWYEKFRAHGFECYDFLRWQFWNDDAVEPWYRQNLLVYAMHHNFSEYGHIGRFGIPDDPNPGCPVGVVHPIFFENPVDVGWRCEQCGTGWMVKPTLDATSGCPNCGVTAC